MLFQYQARKTFDQEIEIEDMSSVCIRCSGIYRVSIEEIYDADYYLLIKTIMGQSFIITYGPVEIEDAENPVFIPGFKVDFSRTKYKESTLEKTINSFINDYKKETFEVTEITPEQFWEHFPDIERAYKNIN